MRAIMLRRAALAALALLLAACASATAQRGADPVTVTVTGAVAGTPDPEIRPAVEGALVWTVDEKNDTVTHWIEPSGTEYREITSAAGVVTVVGNEVWRWSAVPQKVPTLPCPGTPEIPPGKGDAVRSVVERLGEPAAPERFEVTAPFESKDANEVWQEARPLGSAGPYLFVKDTAYVFACGAHGTTFASLVVWDLERRAPVKILSLGDEAAVARHRGEAWRLLRLGEEAFGAEDVKYLATFPRYDERGRLSVDLVYIIDAMGENAWGSYTRSTVVTTAELPARLAPYAVPPRVVGAYAGAHREPRISGWSTVTPAARAILARVLDRQRGGERADAEAR